MKALVFRGSCKECGVFQEHYDDRCDMIGCIVLHHYENPKCNKCGNDLDEYNK